MTTVERNCTRERKTFLQETEIELKIVALISEVDKILRYIGKVWENRLWDALLFSMSGLHLIYCLMANTSSVS